MSNNLQLTVEEISSLAPQEIARHPVVRDRFIFIYDKLWGNGEAAYERESAYWSALLRDKDGGKLLKCTPFSLFTAFIDLAVCGLSLEPGTRALAYLMSRSANVGSRERPQYESRAVLTVSAYGELVMRIRAGQIRHCSNPVLVYDNDEFSFREADGRKTVSYTCNLPHTGHAIVACYLSITRADGSLDYAVMLPEDWQRLANYSWKQNARYNQQSRQWEGKANELYGVQADGTSKIDPGFLMAKCIKHAFKAYPKVRIGRGTELQSQQPEQPELSDEEIYGVDQQPQQAKADESFCNEDPQPQGITVNADEEEGF